MSSVSSQQPVLTTKRRWLQFSLRTLLLVTAIIALGLGYVMYERREAAERWEAVVWFIEIKGHIEVDKPDPIWLAWPRAIIGDYAVQRPRKLAINSFYITDEELAPVARLTSLTSLRLDTGQAWSTEAPNRHGRPSVPPIDGSAQVGITDAALEHLRDLSLLQKLQLDGTLITDAGLIDLQGLKSLRHLSVAHTKVTERGLDQLTALPHLESLNLSGTSVTAAGLKDLALMTQLRRVFLYESKITADEVKELQRRFPNLVIKHESTH
jgi:hypothetical protein